MAYANVHFYEDEPELLDEGEPGSYVLAHWRGRLSLAKSYWLNGTLISTLWAVLVLAITNALNDSQLSLTPAAIIMVSVTVSSLAIALWAWVGIWRSARRHPKQGGSRFWAAAAQVSVILGIVQLAGSLNSLAQWGNETVQLALGGDTLGEMATMSVEGEDLRLDGLLTNGSAAKFAAVLAENPDAKRLVVTSPGGRLYEAKTIAEATRARGLDVTVERECSSACTLVLLAGKKRSLEWRSGVGFHRPSYAGLSTAELDAMSEELALVYREEGLPERFVTRALEAGPDEMWYPDEPLLFDAGVVNGFSDTRVVQDNIVVAQDLSAKLPIQLDPLTTLHTVTAKGEQLVYEYEVDLRESYVLPTFEKAVREELTRDNCSQPMMPQLFADGAVYAFEYSDHRGRPIATIEIDSCP